MAFHRYADNCVLVNLQESERFVRPIITTY